MKALTITMEDSVADWVHIEALRLNTSVSGLVGEMLAEKMRRNAAYEQAMRAALEFKTWGSSNGRYLSREGIHARGTR